MIDGRKVLGLITARGGSKALPGKNLRRLGGRTLIDWCVAAALGSRCIDRVVTSTDSAEIAKEARRCGSDVPFLRPAHLAGDDASSAAVLMHALDTLDESFDIVVLLQPTSPLRQAEDIDGCLALCVGAGAHSATSVCEAVPPPTWIYTLDDADRMQPILPERPQTTRRQDQPTYYVSNGAVFVVTVPWFRDEQRFITGGTLAYVMPRERSVDIDDARDLWLAERIIHERQQQGTQ